MKVPISTIIPTKEVDGFVTVNVPVRMPQEAYNKLDNYGYDFQNNCEDLIRRVYFEILYCEKEQEQKKNETKKKRTSKKKAK